MIFSLPQLVRSASSASAVVRAMESFFAMSTGRWGGNSWPPMRASRAQRSPARAAP
eukprot:CAMPEP_0176141724 /NCGR_PEP_ID=MMETSP0120_2-20121206/72073_1 /TAXON_ID=160619 /ORGANISM="Kryptoperidinium foliaceum, Strain CCMP 1326" /LENGTH=55 /DNA_ID=CAMNT_0017477879 /DNA_START=85 /DNA_END=250 /DNA_ORIENTATION=-